MSKQLNINLGFTADTSQARAQIASLQQELTKLISQPTSLLGAGTTQEINSAIKSVAELQQHLKAATNINTGSLDFAKLSDSIGKSGTSLAAYGEKLRSLGPIGQQAFNSLASAVAQSEIPIRRSNAMLTQFATTLKNTARWQLSSSMLHGVMGGLRTAVGYAKDLNRSLNDIRIVTGYNVDKMTAFAEQANRAAKILSTTTTDYTKASLIYFQQGLNDSEVKERTDITIKMANVTRQSAQEVSDQLTAVWNNFADGTQSLQSFADAMVALGAKTASSSDEIAGGLEKFAAIGETVGLSFDYAASALATITAKTRQSEEVVGTALKTIFARIQGLKLGETLEDGTDLNKYSQALQSVGVDIKDAQGNLKQMDDILEEMGTKWKTLAKDEQVALAQTVAGVRQYNQIISLMDNWDFMKENLKTVENSTGALEKQNKIYEESWEAASKRVKASLEDIFQTLLDDKAFIGILNTFEKIISFVDTLIDSLGGLRGLLTAIGAITTKLFAQQMAQGLTNMATNIKLMTKDGQAAYQKEKVETINKFAQMTGNEEYTTTEDQVRQKYLKGNLLLQQEFIENESKMSALEKEGNKVLLDRNRILGENAIQAAKMLDDSTEKRSDAKFKIQTEMAEESQGHSGVYKWNNLNFEDSAAGLEKIIKQQEAVKNAIKITGNESLTTSEKIEKIKQELEESGMRAKEIEKIEKELEETGADAGALIEKLGKLQVSETRKKTKMVYGYADEESTAEYEELSKSDDSSHGTGATKKSVEEYTNSIRENINAKKQSKDANEELKKSEDGVRTSIKNSQGQQQNWANTLVTCANGVMSLFSAINMLQGAINTLKNPDMSPWEKFVSVGMSISMMITMLIPAFQSLKTIMNADTIATGINTAAKLLNWLASKKSTEASQQEKAAQDADTASNNKNTTSEIANAAAKKANSKTNNGVSTTIGKGGTAGAKEAVGAGAKDAAGAATKSGGAWSKIGSSVGNLTKSLGKLAKAYGGVAAGIAIAVASISIAVSIYNKDATAAKEAAERATAAAEEFAKAQTAYEEFKGVLDNYKEAKDGLSGLTEGTAEYREQLIKANQAALELIESQELIAGQDYSVTADGLIEINKEALERMQQDQLDTLQNAQAYSATMNQQAETAKVRQQQTEFNREYAKGGGWSSEDTAWMGGSIGAGIGGGLAVGAMIGSGAGPIGMAIGAGVGLIVGAIGALAGDDSENEEDEALRILQQAYERDGNSVFTPENIRAELEGKVSEELISSLQDNAVKTAEMVQALAANTAAIKAEIEATAGAANQNNADYQALSKGDQELANKIIANRASEFIANEDSEQYKNAKEKAEELFDWGDSDAYEEYLKAKYGDDAKNYQVVDKGGTNATLQKKNADGTWENVGEEDGLSNDEVIKFLTEHTLKQYSKDSIGLEIQQINKVGEMLEGIQGIDKDAISEVKGSLASGEKIDLTLMSPEQISELETSLKDAGSKLSYAHIDAIKAGLENWSEDAYKARMEQEADNIITAGAEELEVTKGALEAYTDELMASNEALGDNKKLAAETAVETFKFSKALDKMQQVVTDNIKNLRKFDKSNMECYESLGQVQEALEEAFGTKVSANFLKSAENLDLIEKAATGNEEAVKQLGMALSKDFIENLDIAQENLDMFFDQDLSSDEGLAIGDYVYQSIEEFTNSYNSAKTRVLGYIDEISSANLGIGDSISDAIGTENVQDFVNGLNEMAAATGMSVESMQSMLTNMGVTAKVEQKLVKSPIKVPVYQTEEEVVHDGTGFFGDGRRVVRTHTRLVDEETMEGAQYVASISYDGSDPSTEIKVSSGRSALTTPSTGTKTSGGGGGKSKTVQKKAPVEGKKEKDEIERYHEISKSIERQTRTLDKLSKAKDRAYGADKIKAIEKEISALKRLNELDTQHLDQVREKLKADKQIAQIYGVTFNEFGEINNYEEIIKKRMAEWKNEQEAIQQEEIEYEKKKNENENYDQDGSIKMLIDEKKKDSDEFYENFQASITQYEETLGLFEDTMDKIADQWDQIADKLVEKITYQIETKLEFNDFEIKLLEFQITLLGDEFNTFSEKVGLVASKSKLLKDNLDSLEGTVANFWDAYLGKNEEAVISLDKFVEQITKLFPQMMSFMQELVGLDAEMMEYYSNAFNAAETEVTKNIDLIDKGISKLEHLQNMLSILRKDENTRVVGTILEAQYASALDKAKVSADWYATVKNEYEALLNQYNTRKAEGAGEKELEMLEKNLETIRNKMLEADEQRLSDLEVLGEKAQAILENDLKTARKKLEEFWVGSSLEEYMTELDRLSKKQEEYLTATNKMYETNKLIRQAQLEMDKTENNRAKQQYNDYIKYIGQLQESGKLSQYELSIAQAKYELLQAQIALEEAQEAKNQVRLTRDAEGNYGYVYTANEDKVSEAEQAVADAENALYNTGLKGAQDYQSKKAETLQEAIDTFASIEEQYQTGQIETEAEFNAKMQEAKQYYYERLKEYDDLYYMALETMQETSYSNTIDYELNSINVFDNFEEGVRNYLEEVQAHFDNYDQKVDKVREEVGEDLSEVREKTKEVTDKTNELAKETEVLTGKIDEELLSVREATFGWAKYRDTLYENIEASRELIQNLREIQELQMGNIKDYSLFIKDQVAQGYEYDDRIVQEALAKRWEKMGGVDNYNYQEMINEYVQQYADENNMSFKEAETALKNDSWYKTLQMLRDYKIERTNWSTVEANIKSNNPDADTSWIQDVRDDKMSKDWGQKITNYVKLNPGISLDDEYLQEMLQIRQTAINEGKLNETKATKGLSNEELLGTLNSQWIDTRHSDEQDVTDPGAGANPNAPVIAPLTNEGIKAYAKEVRKGTYGDNPERTQNLKAKGLSDEDIQKIQDEVNRQIANEKAIQQTPSSDQDSNKQNQTPSPPAPTKCSKCGKNLDKCSCNKSSIPTQISPMPLTDEERNAVLMGMTTDTKIGATKKRDYASKVTGNDDKTSRDLDLISSTAISTPDAYNGLYSETQREINGIGYIKGSTYWYKKSDIKAIGTGITKIGPDGEKYELYRHTIPKGSQRYFLGQYDGNGKLIKKYDTGGYTGEWGPEGKLAVLHQKELVLNAQDTENFLTATQMLREISQMLDNNALVASLGAINLHAMTIGSPADQVLQQEVTIHADFPNVTDHNEIEIAIDNLINAASQHAFKV